MIPQSPAECQNLLLSMLPEYDYQSLLPHLELVETPLHFKLCERDQPIQYAYFPLVGGHSILATMQDGTQVEVGTVGFEGMSTTDLILGGDVAVETNVCQVPGTALRMPTEVFRRMTVGDTTLRRVASRYLQAYLSMVSQNVACNQLHDIEHRLAKWLLMSHDRVHRQDFTLTQEYLAAMLGVHRPSVSIAAGILQRAGVIEYKRGRIQVLDRQALCHCTEELQAHPGSQPLTGGNSAFSLLV
jgi:CRP-like cAMP-binding protein